MLVMASIASRGRSGTTANGSKEISPKLDMTSCTSPSKLLFPKDDGTVIQYGLPDGTNHLRLQWHSEVNTLDNCSHFRRNGCHV